MLRRFFIIYQKEEDKMSEICSVKGEVLVVKLDGDLDHHVTEIIREEIDSKTIKYRIRNIIFDFRNVAFMDSSGIGLLMGRYRKIQDIGGSVYVSNVGYTMQRIFRMSGLYKILKQSKEADRIVNNKEATYEQN